MDQETKHNESASCLPFSSKAGISATKQAPQCETPEVLERSYTNLLTLEDEYEGLTAKEAETDVQQCRELLLDQEQQISNLARKINQEKSKLERCKGDLEEAEVCLSMAQSYEAAVAGWRESLQSFESLLNPRSRNHPAASLADQAWEDLKQVEQQVLSQLEGTTTIDTISVPYGSTEVCKTESLLPDEVEIEILGDYLPVSILGTGLQLDLKQCQEGTAIYAVHCL